MLKALIPVRSGSVRVQNKNIRPFANSNLLEIKINQLKRIKKLDGIIVNSNDDKMLKIADSLGIESVKRDEYFATSTVSINEVYFDLAKNCNSDDILFADVTNPLVKDETINNVIEMYYNNLDKYDSINTVNSIKMFLYKDNKPLNYDEENKPKSQDLPELYAINSAINILSKDTMLKRRAFVGYKPHLYVLDGIEGLDIDNQIDFDFAEFIYERCRLNEK